MMHIQYRKLFWWLGFTTAVMGLIACQTPPTQPTTQAVTTVPHALPTLTPSRMATAVPSATAVSPLTPTPRATTSTAQTTAEEEPLATATGTAVAQTGLDPAKFGPGSLIQLEMASQVGVLLDEYPAEMRDRVAETLANEPESVWLSRALQQINLTYNRLHFRDYVYRREGINNRFQLPLPPQDVWQVVLDPAGPQRQTVDGHELVMWAYTFSSILLSDEASAGQAEPLLGRVGGVWEEPFILPTDPTMLLQRTGNACFNEAGFPPNSYDSENVASYFDYTCTAESVGLTGCHRTIAPTLSCMAALRNSVGTISTVMRFERLPWNAATADQVRRGELTTTAGPDLMVVASELANHRLVYRYFGEDSCAYGEGNVGGTGWRRLLLFDAMVHNVGSVGLDIGLVEGEDPATNIFEYDPCHNHIHYSNYGEFLFGTDPYPNKRAFCVESTGRPSNNEASPLTHSFSCRVQGIQAGWVDEYGAGLDGQWIDVTTAVPTDTQTIEPLLLPLTFRVNTDQFLCEGDPVLDGNGKQQYAWSGLYNSQGLPMAYPLCQLIDKWDVNNEGSLMVTLPPTGSFVTQACAQGESGPLRNCGFTPSADDLVCTAGEPVQMSCQINPASGETAAPQVLRVCESSAVLGTGTACTYNSALANLLVTAAPTPLTFTCPRPRDAQEPGGLYAFYTAPLLSADTNASISCEVVE